MTDVPKTNAELVAKVRDLLACRCVTEPNQECGVHGDDWARTTWALADALEVAGTAESARLRDLEFPEYVPESVTDAAFASQADWYVPGTGDGHAMVLVPAFIESVTEAAYRATLAHLNEAPGE